MKAQRTQIQQADASDPERLRTVLNAALLELSARLEALESVKGITVLPEISFETGGTLSPTSGCFSLAGGGVRTSCPFSPTGLVLLRLEPARSATVSALASDVKWHFGAGPNAGDGVLHIDFVTGLLINTAYKMRVGVTRA